MKISRGIFGLFLSNVLEYYDIVLYGYMVTRLTPLFFPHQDPFISSLLGFTGFALGFVMRPVGGAVFGHVADRYGRKKALTFSILLTALPTTVMGLLPTYETIGIIAPIALICCRLLQGVCVGGESAGILVYVMEKNGIKNGNFVGSLLCSTSFVGVILAALSSAFFNQSFMPEWSWRVPFLLGIAVAIYGYYLRKQIHETEAFKQCKPSHKVNPFMVVMKNHQRGLICTFGLGAACSIPYHMLTIYVNSALTARLHLTLSQATVRTVCVIGALTLILPFIGKVVDRVGNRKVMLLSMLCMTLFSYPVFQIIMRESLVIVTVSQILLIIIYGGFLASISTFLMDLFPVNVRSSGIGVAYNLGNSVFGGTTPLISQLLVGLTGQISSPAFYLVFSGILGIISTLCAKLESEKTIAKIN